MVVSKQELIEKFNVEPLTDDEKKKLDELESLIDRILTENFTIGERMTVSIYYDWYPEKVRRAILKKYREAGWDVETIRTDKESCIWEFK